jgi:hypothetical protein
MFYGGEGPSIRLIVQGSEDDSSLGYLIVSLESEPRTRFLTHKFPLVEPAKQIVDLTDTGFGARFSNHTIEAATTCGAPLGRIVSFSTERPETDAWVEVVPQMSERLYGYERWKGIIVAHYLDGPTPITFH